MYCQNCGSQVNDGVKFCENCGHRMIEDSPQQDNVQGQGIQSADTQRQATQPVDVQQAQPVQPQAAQLGVQPVPAQPTAPMGVPPQAIPASQPGAIPPSQPASIPPQPQKKSKAPLIIGICAAVVVVVAAVLVILFVVKPFDGPSSEPASTEAVESSSSSDKKSSKNNGDKGDEGDEGDEGSGNESSSKSSSSSKSAKSGDGATFDDLMTMSGADLSELLEKDGYQWDKAESGYKKQIGDIDIVYGSMAKGANSMVPQKEFNSLAALGSSKEPATYVVGASSKKASMPELGKAVDDVLGEYDAVKSISDGEGTAFCLIKWKDGTYILGMVRFESDTSANVSVFLLYNDEACKQGYPGDEYKGMGAKQCYELIAKGAKQEGWTEK